MNIKLHGITEQIVEGAVKKGLAKTKTDAIVLGLVELDHKYKLTKYQEDEEDLTDARRILDEIKNQKKELLSLSEFKKRAKLRA